LSGSLELVSPTSAQDALAAIFAFPAKRSSDRGICIGTQWDVFWASFPGISQVQNAYPPVFGVSFAAKELIAITSACAGCSSHLLQPLLCVSKVGDSDNHSHLFATFYANQKTTFAATFLQENNNAEGLDKSE
jgi:hypothetical protein